MALDMDNVKQTATAVAAAEGKKIVGSAAVLYRTLQRVDEFANGDPEVVAKRIKDANDMLRGIAPEGTDVDPSQITVEQALAALPDQARAIAREALVSREWSVDNIAAVYDRARSLYQNEQTRNNGSVVDVAAVPALKNAVANMSTAATAVEDGSANSPLAHLTEAVKAAVAETSKSKLGRGKRDDAIDKVDDALKTLLPLLNTLLAATDQVKTEADNAPPVATPALAPLPALPAPSSGS